MNNQYINKFITDQLVSLVWISIMPDVWIFVQRRPVDCIYFILWQGNNLIKIWQSLFNVFIFISRHLPCRVGRDLLYHYYTYIPVSAIHNDPLLSIFSRRLTASQSTSRCINYNCINLRKIQFKIINHIIDAPYLYLRK